MKFGWVPWSFVLFRALSAPLLLWDGIDGVISSWFLPLFIAAFLSDIFDGMIARRLGVSTARIRKADGIVDTAFYLASISAAVFVFKDNLLVFVLPLLLLVAGQVSLQVLSRRKFGRGTSFHGWSAKLFGLTMAIALICLFGLGRTEFIWLAFAAGIVNTFEEMAMVNVLPDWRHDVWSLGVAKAIASKDQQGVE